MLLSDFRDFVDIMKLLKYLIGEKGANVNAKADDGKTVIFPAVAYCTMDIVKYLVEEANAGLTTLFRIW